MRALVTGGNGFLGSHLVRALTEQGHQVRVLYQEGTDHDRLAGLDPAPELTAGDLLDPPGLALACRGCDVVFHLAGVVQDWGPVELFQRVNVGGTANLLRAAVQERVRRLVFTSSLAVHRYVGITDGDEAWPRDNIAHPYGASKIACEDLLLKAHAAGDIEAVVVRPGVVPFGTGDRLSLPELCRHHRAYRHVAGGRARFCTAFAPDLATGLLACAEVPHAAGEVYIIGGDETPSWREFMDILFEGVGLTPPRRSVPLGLALTGAVAAEAWARISGRPPLINRYRVALAGRDCVFSNRKVREHLGWSPATPLAEAMEQTIRWLNGYLEDL